MWAADRIRLRPCRLEDLDAVHALWTDAGVRRYLFDDRSMSRDEARSFLEASVASFAERGYGLWLFFEREGSEVAGFAGLLHSPEGPPNLIYGTRPALWGRGYAREAASAVLRYAFGVLHLERVAADVDEPNEASARVLEALGMSRVRRGIVNGRPLLYYEIRAGGANA